MNSRRELTRRTALQVAAGTLAAATLPPITSQAAPKRRSEPPAVRRLIEKIEAGMAKYAIPGVGLGLWYRGQEYVRGFGVTSTTTPTPVTADTVFRIGSTGKTFTGTAVMRLVEQGRLRLDQRVQHHLPDFKTADPAVAARVTVRELLNHSAGWAGDYFLDTGQGDDALSKYVAGMSKLPQLTKPGSTFHYNNAAISLAGRLIEVVTGKTYEQATRELVIDPLGLDHSRFFLHELTGFSVAQPHKLVDGKAVPEPSFFPMPRAVHAAGGLISSSRDQVRYARFHLGDKSLPRLLDQRTLVGMRRRPGPGGTLFVELDGVGVTWMLRPTAEGPRIVQHGGNWSGHHSGFLMVPERDFAISLLTNSDGGPGLVAELFADDWALREFARVSNLPAVPRRLSPRQLAKYEGVYAAEQIGFDGKPVRMELELAGDEGELLVRMDGADAMRLAFYRRDFVLALDLAGEPTHSRANFVRGADGEVEWFRFGGRIFRRGTAQAATRQAPRTSRSPLPYPWPL